MSVDDDWDKSGLVGKLVDGKYLITRTLSQTAHSEIYEAEDARRGGPVALEVLKASHPAAASLQKRARERKPLPTFDHPSIVDVQDIGAREDGDPYIVREIVRGDSLRSILDKGPLPARRALAIARQLLGAAEAAHTKGVVHRDINPANIMVVPTGRDSEVARILGFGLASVNTAKADTFADPGYIAPEHVLHEAAGPAADLYAIGAVLFEMLTGHPPFHADSAKALMRLHAYAPAQTLKHRAPDRAFTAPTEELIERALAKRPAQRYRSASEMLAALDDAATSVDEADAAARAAASEPAQPPVDDSLLLLARDLMPAQRDPMADAPAIPINVDRTVPALPLSARIARGARRVTDPVLAIARKVIAFVRALDRRIQLALVAVLAVVVIVVIVLAASGDDASAPVATSPSATPAELAARRDAALPKAKALLAQNKHREAAELLARELGPGTPANEELRETLRAIVAADDPRAGVLALDVAGHMTPVPAALVGEIASSAPNAEIRHRAVKLAEQRGFAVRVDRVTSWSLDLQQATGCDERRALIGKLVGTGDARAAAALRSVRQVACLTRDVDAGLAKLHAAK
jgi:serine/threonine-protein kinase